MSKQLECQRYIYKIHSSRLRAARWKLTLPIDEARRNEEVISLASSQVLRWIDELNGITDSDQKAKDIIAKIRSLRKETPGVRIKTQIKQLYSALDALQFKPDYMCLIIDKEKDYYRACKGFSINGISYVRLLGTNGGIKNSTIVFVSERHAAEITRRINNGRDMTKPLVPAKLEAYKALACSASIPVSMPNGLLVVNDCFTKFKADTIYLDDERDGEPTMEFRPDTDIELDASDGFGLMCPELAERWSGELGLEYTSSGFNTRFSFEKGMVFTFDFKAFARDVSENYIVKDVWGNEVDIREVELILTESMLKLWDSYASCDDYIENCESNGYTFGIAKTCPEKLESERRLNYQFIQSYDLDDEDIDELIEPTMQEIKDVLGGDWRKTLLFLCGSHLDSHAVSKMNDDYIKAIMIDRRVMNDPYVQKSIYHLIKNRINEAKVGQIKVHANYSIVSGDPYALCQSMFGMEVTGLLKSGEIYNKFWSDLHATKLACFRAPMTTHENIRIVHPCSNIAVSYWYQYMTACTVFNAWDTCTAALNGMDFDGDLVMLTDNRVLVEKHITLPTIMCVQRKAAKKIPTEEDTIISNINSFGNDIGRITNWITSMFEVRSRFEKTSHEYDVLSYRIKCGQLLQQNAIDKAKGIISKPMPASWHDTHSANIIDDPAEKRLYRSIVADKKPYFMCYIYPDLMHQYKKYIKNTDRNCIREFGVSIKKLQSMPYSELTERQRDFLYYYNSRLPVGIGDCVMNKICHKFEDVFDGYFSKNSTKQSFDYGFMSSDATYTKSQFTALKTLYDDYTQRLKGYMVGSAYSRNDSEAPIRLSSDKKFFRRDCDMVCPNSAVLCNILLDLCYKKEGSKKFVWDMSGEEIINNLLKQNDMKISYPVEDINGDIEYCGERFSITTEKIGDAI